MNEPLRRALLRARLREDDIAARLGVDPKTVRRWLTGRVPYRTTGLLSPSSSGSMRLTCGLMRVDRWRRGTPEELGTVYPHRWAVPREAWVRLFGSAEHEIAILAYSVLFLAEDAGILQILTEKGREGVTVRIALGDPDGPNALLRGEEEGIGDAMAAKIRNALMLYRPLCAAENIEIRLHRTVLYSSIYRADERLLVNQHSYGIPAAQAPVFCLRDTDGGEMAALYPMPWGLGIWVFVRGSRLWLRWVVAGRGYAGGRRVVPGDGRFHGRRAGVLGRFPVFALVRLVCSRG